jgi:phosphoribosylformylglycinamidine (FGAM) synthase-like enzyme
MGLAFDDWDLEYYTKLFKDMGRDPTNVELFDIAQSNSEHSRHWFFKGELVIDGDKKPHNLMDVVRAPLDVSCRTLAVQPEQVAGTICTGSGIMHKILMDWQENGGGFWNGVGHCFVFRVSPACF